MNLNLNMNSTVLMAMAENSDELLLLNPESLSVIKSFKDPNMFQRNGVALSESLQEFVSLAKNKSVVSYWTIGNVGSKERTQPKILESRENDFDLPPGATSHDILWL